MNDKILNSKIVWLRSLLNGVLAYIYGFIAALIPAIITAFSMGFSMGKAGEDPAVISEEISSTISAMYIEKIWLILLFIFAVAFFLFIRSRRIAKKYQNVSRYNGLVVAALPVLAAVFYNETDWVFFVEITAYAVAGYLGGLLQTPKEVG